MDFEKLCEKVFGLHDDIRYAGVINDSGTLLAGGMRKGLDSITEERTISRPDCSQKIDAPTVR